MCGIVGFREDWVRSNGLDPEAAVQAALERLRWRGPDGAHWARIGDWWLGCTRLAITQPGSRQPVVRRGGRFAAVLNGAITNARELWAELLPGAGRRAAPPNDAWLPLLAIERDRHDLLARMRGHHAYVVIDRDTGQPTLGQDRYGEKPLFLLDRRGPPGVVAFASTPAALRELGMPALSSQPRLERLLRFGFASLLPQRFSKSLHLVEPLRGHVLTGRGLAPVPTPAIGRRPLRKRVVESVRRCADTTVGAGLFLSGGVDSSCLAAALRALALPLPAFQFRAAAAPGDERDRARAVAAHCGLPLHEVDAGTEVLDALPHLTRCAGLPLGDPSVLAVHAVARAAATAGVRVMLGGEGADELFYGYRRYRALARIPRLPWLHGTAPRWGSGYLVRCWRAVVADDPVAELLAVTPPAFVATVLAEDLRFGRHRHRRDWRHTGAELAQHARDADLSGYLRLDLLPKVDVATMAAGVEARCPYLEGDRSRDACVANDLGKRRLKAAFADDLPPEVLRQPKRGFALPLDRWFRGELPLLDLLRDRRTLERPHLVPAGVGLAIDKHRAGTTDLGHGLYLLAAYEIFLRCQEEEAGVPGNDPAATA